MNNMKPINTKNVSFESLITSGCVYVDKTKYLYRLLQYGGSYFFFSRPRYFGKTLLISTLKAAFEGKKELFKDLYLGTTDYEFKKYPIVHLDLSECKCTTEDATKEWLADKLEEIASQYNVKLREERDCYWYLQDIIRNVGETNRVVVLIDNLDAPLAYNIDNPEVEDIRDVFLHVLEILKALSAYLHFVFVASETEYSRVSIFSGANNLSDIGYRGGHYLSLLGYTEEELETYFKEYIEQGVKKTGKTREEYLADLKNQYGGYCYDKDEDEEGEWLYNPNSVGRFFLDGGVELQNYWDETEERSRLVHDIARRTEYNVIREFHDVISSDIIIQNDIIELSHTDSPTLFSALLFQMGYLAIKDAFCYQEVLSLDFPNNEVKEVFLKNFLGAILGDEVMNSFNPDTLIKHFRDGETQKAIIEIQSLLAKASCSETEKLKETAYVNGLGIILRAVGAEFNLEKHALFLKEIREFDVTLKTPKHIYVIAFNLDKSAGWALRPIKERFNADTFKAEIENGGTVHLVGLGFSLKSLNISGYKETTL